MYILIRLDKISRYMYCVHYLSAYLCCLPSCSLILICTTNVQTTPNYPTAVRERVRLQYIRLLYSRPKWPFLQVLPYQAHPEHTVAKPNSRHDTVSKSKHVLKSSSEVGVNSKYTVQYVLCSFRFAKTE